MQTVSATALELVQTAPQESITTEIATLITNAQDWRLRGRDYRVALGRVLVKLRDLLAKPGYGSFMKTVREDIDMPYSTANDYMQEALILDGHYGIRNDVDTEVVPYDPNDGTVDPVALAIISSRADEMAAKSRADNPMVLRDFLWKFRLIDKASSDQLKEARKSLNQVDAAQFLISRVDVGPRSAPSPTGTYQDHHRNGGHQCEACCLIHLSQMHKQTF